MITTEIEADVEEYRAEDLARLDVVLTESMRVMAGKCRDCKGQGRLRADGMSTDIMIDCEKCEGTGRRYGVGSRMLAADKVMRAVNERAKLRGLHAPEKLAMTNTKGEDLVTEFEREIRSWSEEDVDRELAELTAEPDDL